MAHIIPILELRNNEIDLLSFQIAYHKYLKSNGRPASRPLQAGFTFTFPSGRHDALFLHPLLRKERNPVSGLKGDFISGTIRFYEGSRDGHLLFKFSFEYGTITKWKTMFDTHTGMVCHMHLMAGVVFYRNALAVEPWVPNRERYPDKYLGFRNPGANIAPPDTPVSFAVKKVEGPYDREGKLVQEVKKGEQHTYHATLSKSPDEVTLGEVTWAVAYDDEDTSQARRLFSGGQAIDSRTIKADLAVEEGREKFRIYAYRGSVPKEGVSVDVTRASGKAIIIAFPEADPEIPTNQKFYRWLETTLGDGDHKLSDAGHAGIIIINMTDSKEYPKGRAKYFDFGRYNLRKNELGERGKNEGVVRSSDFSASFSVPDWNFRKTEEENSQLMMQALLNKGAFKKDYGKMIGALVNGLEFNKMIKYALYMQARGLIPFGGYLSSTDKNNATYCAKFVRGVAKQGGMDWDWDSFTGRQNVMDVVETYHVKIIELKNE